MSFMLPHLNTGWAVDQAIVSEEERVVVIRFGHDWDPACMKMDETLYRIANKVKNFAVIYVVRIGLACLTSCRWTLLRSPNSQQCTSCMIQ